MYRTGVIAAVCCAFALCLALVGCGANGTSDSGEDALVGNWNLVSMVRDGVETGEEDIKALSDLGLDVSFEAKADGKCELVLFGEPTAGTWKATGPDEGEIEMDGSEITYSFEDDKLVVIQKDSSMTFKKAAVSDASSDSAASSGEASK